MEHEEDGAQTGDRLQFLTAGVLEHSVAELKQQIVLVLEREVEGARQHSHRRSRRWRDLLHLPVQHGKL